MPAWGEIDGGLTKVEIETVLGYLRTLGGGAKPEPTTAPARWIKADPVPGKAIYASVCASCHGPDGKGGDGPALNNRQFLKLASDTFLFGTVSDGRRGAIMPAFGKPMLDRRMLTPDEIDSVIAFLRTWEGKQP